MKLGLINSAWAQAGRYHATIRDNQITVVDTRNGRTIISPNLQRVVHDTRLTTTVNLIPQEGGFDLAVTYINHGEAPASMGLLAIPVMRWKPYNDAFDDTSFGHGTGRAGIAAPTQLDSPDCDTKMIGTGPFKLDSFDPTTGVWGYTLANAQANAAAKSAGARARMPPSIFTSGWNFGRSSRPSTARTEAAMLAGRTGSAVGPR